jgi:ADP-heptose:LPS heptosyltransferase
MNVKTTRLSGRDAPWGVPTGGVPTGNGSWRVPTDPNKILVIRFSSIGDIVLTSPVVRCLKEQLPNAEIHYLTKKQYGFVLSANPHLDRIWSYDHNFSELIPQLRAAGFDFIVDLHRNFRSAYVKQRLRRPSASFPKLNIEKWLMVNFKMNMLPDIHIVDRYFRAAAPLGIRNDGQGLDYFIPSGDEVRRSDLPSTHQHGYIAVVIGGKHNTKILPAGKTAEICNQLTLPVILLGGTEDKERGLQIVSMTGEKTFNACGRFNFNQSASLVRQAAAVLTNDTGLMHVAAAFRKPVVSAWGNTIPAFGMYPYYPERFRQNSMIAEIKGLSCRPCSKLGFSECPKKHFRCMEEIGVSEVAGFLNREWRE